MAMSFSRPDPSSPASIADATFGTSRRGFDQAEVKDFLRMVAAEFGRLRERERFLERELQSAQSNPDLRGAQIDDEAMTRLLGEEAMRVLTTARESGHEIREKAEQAAALMLSEASDDAARVREEADIEASRRRGDAAADAEAEVAMAKQQGREMVNEARAYRERVLSELARRRELAREQIEQLVHGRDRLMQAFERARLVAVDVVAEMQPLGEPDEYVNLSPTTGPLPVMIANSPRPDASAPVDDAAESSIPATAGDLRIVGEDEREPVVDGATADDEIAGDASADDDGAPGTDTDSDTDAAESDEISAATDVAPVEEHTESGIDDATLADHEVVEEVPADAVVDDEVAEVAEVAETVATYRDTDIWSTDETAETDETDDTDDTDNASEMDDSRGDVVVDLFARLRAGAADAAPADADSSDAEADDADADDTEPDDAEMGDESTPEDSNTEALRATEIEADTEPAADDASVEPTSFELRDEVLTPLIVASAKRLKRVLADEQNEVLDALRRNEAVHELDTLLPGASEHATRYSDAIAEELLEAVHAGSATSNLGGRNIRKALATESVSAASDVLEMSLVTPLRDRLAHCVSDGGGDNAVVTKKVRSVYREWKTRHIDETLDDILRTAHGRGVLAGFTLEEPVVWEIDERLPACPDCEDNALAGAVAAGAEFPTGHTFAPAHQGCRCLLAAADR